MIPDIGFAILPQHFKKGYTYEATKIYLQFLKNNSNIKEICAIVLPNNYSCINLLKKLNFSFKKETKKNLQKLHHYVHYI